MTVMISSEFKVIFYILIFVLVPVGYSVQNQSLKKKKKQQKCPNGDLPKKGNIIVS